MGKRLTIRLSTTGTPQCEGVLAEAKKTGQDQNISFYRNLRYFTVFDSI
jgi:hypothetical protein